MEEFTLVGREFGLWTVLEYAGVKQRAKRKRHYWKCECKCGKVKDVLEESLEGGKSKGCGCSRQARGMSRTRVYHIWVGMIQRCYNKRDTTYEGYGGIGIKVCESWKKSFVRFYEDMGEANGLTLERIDNDDDYTPENCKWATQAEQNYNKSSTVWITYKGENKTIRQWAKLDWTPDEKSISSRRDLGWSSEEILLVPYCGHVKTYRKAKLKV